MLGSVKRNELQCKGNQYQKALIMQKNKFKSFRGFKYDRNLGSEEKALKESENSENMSINVTFW